MARIDRRRRDNGHHGPVEVGVERFLLLGRELARAHEANALGGKQRLELIEETSMLLVGEPAGALGDGRPGLGGGQPVGPGCLVVLADPPLEPRHADHGELVEVRADDGQELDPLQKRHRRVFGLLEHPPVELEPRELAVDEGLAVHALEAFLMNVSSSRSPCRTPSSHTVSTS